MGKTKFTLGKFSFPFFLHPAVQIKKHKDKVKKNVYLSFIIEDIGLSLKVNLATYWIYLIDTYVIYFFYNHENNKEQ
jgi:hypothetical protein